MTFVPPLKHFAFPSSRALHSATPSVHGSCSYSIVQHKSTRDRGRPKFTVMDGPSPSTGLQQARTGYLPPSSHEGNIHRAPRAQHCARAGDATENAETGLCGGACIWRREAGSRGIGTCAACSEGESQGLLLRGRGGGSTRGRHRSGSVLNALVAVTTSLHLGLSGMVPKPPEEAQVPWRPEQECHLMQVEAEEVRPQPSPAL